MSRNWIYAGLIFGLSLVSCSKETSNSESKIVGPSAFSAFESRTRLLVNNRTGETCTAIFIKPAFAFTAGHCVPDSVINDLNADVSIDGVIPYAAGKITLNSNVAYNLDAASRDIAFLYFRDDGVRRLHGPNPNIPGLVRSPYFDATQPTAMAIKGFGDTFVRTKQENGQYVPIKKGGGDLTGIGRAGSPGVKQLRSCRMTIRQPSTTFLANQELIEIKPSDQIGEVCMPNAGDSGGPLYDENGNLVGMAVAVEYGPNQVTRAVYLSLRSQAFRDVLNEFFARIAAMFGF